MRDTVPDWARFEAPVTPIAGAGLGPCVGRDSGEPVTDGHPASRDHHGFMGATINRVAVDLIGEPYVELEREAAAMLSRG